MKKAKIITPDTMGEDQIQEDISMTPMERLEKAFQLSDLALEIQQEQKVAKEESSSIQWIELHKISSKK